jgi:hypothetical protein
LAKTVLIADVNASRRLSVWKTGSRNLSCAKLWTA